MSYLSHFSLQKPHNCYQKNISQRKFIDKRKNKAKHTHANYNYFKRDIICWHSPFIAVEKILCKHSKLQFNGILTFLQMETGIDSGEWDEQKENRRPFFGRQLFIQIIRMQSQKCLRKPLRNLLFISPDGIQIFFLFLHRNRHNWWLCLIEFDSSTELTFRWAQACVTRFRCPKISWKTPIQITQ